MIFDVVFVFVVDDDDNEDDFVVFVVVLSRNLPFGLVNIRSVIDEMLLLLKLLLLLL